MLSDWDIHDELNDPFCGSGTIPIEASLIAKNVAPGLRREFAFQKWPDYELSNYRKAIEEARSLMQIDRNTRITGSDIDRYQIETAKENAARAGLHNITFIYRDFQKLPYEKMSPTPLTANALEANKKPLNSITILAQIFKKPPTVQLSF
jgi:putative N6-adenine-specific DNA methylase